MKKIDQEFLEAEMQTQYSRSRNMVVMGVTRDLVNVMNEEQFVLTPVEMDDGRTLQIMLVVVEKREDLKDIGMRISSASTAVDVVAFLKTVMANGVKH